MAPKAFPNKYSAQCVACGGRVEIAQGLTTRGDTGWLVTHKVCPQQAPEAQALPVALAFTPTAEQAEVIRLFSTGENLVIQAGAGAGKTSTCKLVAQQAHANGRRGQYLVYNRAAMESVVASKSMPGVRCDTTHRLARQAVGYVFADRINMKRQHPSQVARTLGVQAMTLPDGRHLAAGWLASKAIGMVKQFCLTADTEIGTQHLLYVDGIDEANEAGEPTYANNNFLAKALLPVARRAWADVTNAQGGVLKVEHDYYLKLWSLNDPIIDRDYILLDEAQDTNPVTMAIVEFNAARGVQIVCVGDEQQVLYAWRGAIDAMAIFEASGARLAFLSQSFRFGPEIAEVANVILDRLSARIRVRGFAPVSSTVGPVEEPDAILTRTNAGAVRALMDVLPTGRQAHLVGGVVAIIMFCKAALDLQAGRSTDHNDLGIFGSWAEVVEFSQDEAGADLSLLVKLVEQFGAQEIIDALEASADDKAILAPGWDGVTISTAHKSKGLEWGSVQIGSDFTPPKAGATMQPAELRLAYVAVTRAQFNLDMTSVPHFLLGGEEAGLE